MKITWIINRNINSLRELKKQKPDPSRFSRLISLSPSLSLFFFFFLATPHGMWDLSFPTRGLTHAPCSGSVES